MVHFHAPDCPLYGREDVHRASGLVDMDYLIATGHGLPSKGEPMSVYDDDGQPE